MTSQLQLSTPTTGVIDPAAGERAKQAGIAKIRQLDPKWATECDKGIRTMAARGVPFQAADLIEEGLVTEPPHPNCWGARFTAASNAGVIESAGYGKSKRATVHKSICHLWIGRRAA